MVHVVSILPSGSTFQPPFSSVGTASASSGWSFASWFSSVSEALMSISSTRPPGTEICV